MEVSRHFSSYAEDVVRGCCLRLGIFFLTGTILGVILCLKTAADRFDCLAVGQALTGDGVSFLQLMLRDLLPPLSVVLLCFTTFGCLLSPLIAGAHGFVLTYTVAGLKLLKGGEGVIVAFTRLLPGQLLLTASLLCLCCQCSVSSGALMQFSLGRFPRQYPVYERSFFRRVLVCLFFSGVALLADIALFPGSSPVS